MVYKTLAAHPLASEEPVNQFRCASHRPQPLLPPPLSPRVIDHGYVALSERAVTDRPSSSCCCCCCSLSKIVGTVVCNHVRFIYMISRILRPSVFIKIQTYVYTGTYFRVRDARRPVNTGHFTVSDPVLPANKASAWQYRRGPWRIVTVEFGPCLLRVYDFSRDGPRSNVPYTLLLLLLPLSLSSRLFVTPCRLLDGREFNLIYVHIFFLFPVIMSFSEDELSVKVAVRWVTNYALHWNNDLPIIIIIIYSNHWFSWFTVRN